MIAQLTGTLVEKEPTGLIVETGGVGYLVAVPVSTLAALPETGAEVTLYTHQYVREDVLALYGFAAKAERRLFMQLLSVSGIGPKVALAILSLASPDDIRAAISAGDADFHIDILPDETAGTLSVIDNGIGMNREDLVANLGTIARSGTAAFVDGLSGDKETDLTLIGR
ncbi:MAG: Holliday junction branch migration protein RuvA, partial [Patescibacteria group bacterium]